MIEGWKKERLGKLAQIKDGTHQTPKYVNYGIPFYSVENVTNNEFRNTKYITEEEHKKLTVNYKIEKGDILMTRIGSIGNCKYVDWNVNASFYVSLALLKCNDLIDAKFLAFYSNTKAFKKSILLNSLQHAVPMKINLGKISDVEIYYPENIKEQKAIVDNLSNIDQLINSLQKIIVKKEKIFYGMMEKIYNKSNLKAIILNDKYKVEKGNGLTSSEFKKGRIPVVAGGIKEAGFHNSYNRKENTITISSSGANAGFVNFYKGKIFATDCTTINEVKYDIKYLYYLLKYKQSEIYKMQIGGAQPHVYCSEIKNMLIYVEEDIYIQKNIAKMFENMSNEMNILRQKLNKYKQIKEGMMEDLLTGKVRLNYE